jgi:transcriptional regulator with XRE-family HTH domain
MSKFVDTVNSEARRRLSINVKRLRLERGMSQESLATACAFHRTYVYQMEHVIANVTLDVVDKLAMALGVDVGELFAPAPSHPEIST